MYILGISAFYHDSAAAIIHDGKIIAAAQEERFTRKKHDPAFPVNAVKYCLEEAGVTIDQLEAIAFYDKPLLKFERLLETYYSFAPRGVRSFIMSMPVWMKEKMFMKRIMREELQKVGSYDKRKLKFLFPEHHLSHAASAFYPSKFEKAAILTVDGVGEWATVSICKGEGNKIEVLKELHFPHSLGLLYSAFTYFLGFRVNSGEYKLMGLAPYGNASSDSVKKFVEIIKSSLVNLQSDGSVWLDQDYFNYATGLRMANDSKWEALFGFKRRLPEEPILQHHCDLAMAIQQITEETTQLMAQDAMALAGSKNLCMAGGVALNCVSNGKMVEAGIVDDIFIQPAAGDAGGAPGAALAAYHIYFDKSRMLPTSRDAMQGSYLGPDVEDLDIRNVIKKYHAVGEKESDAALCARVAALITEGNVIGWVQGRMEFGPRALGARSILGDPRSSEMQSKLNLKIKYRESFRPFAPVVLAEDAHEVFEMNGISPYMLMVHGVKQSLRKPLPDGYDNLNLRDKLYHDRSQLPAITHVDNSARIQTVHEDTTPRFYNLLKEFKKLTGFGVLVNTSFNVRGEPIVCTPEDAYRCFMRTEMDYLVVGDYIFEKSAQPQWQEKAEWQTEFVLD